MNEYYVVHPTNSDLEHHGVLGQKWGRKNGPPYPLGAGDHSAAEKRAGWKKSLSATAKKVANKATSGAKKTIEVGSRVAKRTAQGAGKAARFAGKAALIGTLAGGGPIVGAARLAAYRGIKKKIDSKRIGTTMKERHAMSDDELNYRVGRVRQENELRRLESENVDAGRAMVRDIGKTAVKTMATGAVLFGAKYVASRFSKVPVSPEKQMDAWREFGDAMFRGGAKKK